MTPQDQAHSESKPGLRSSGRGTNPRRISPGLPSLGWSINRVNQPETRGERVKPAEDSGEGRAGKGRGVARTHAGGGRPSRAHSPPGRARTHFAESVLMEPVTSMSPARNSWYLVQAMAAEEGGATLRGPPRPPRSLETTAPDPVTLGSRVLTLPGRASHDSRRPRLLPARPAPGAGCAGSHRVTMTRQGSRSPHF